MLSPKNIINIFSYSLVEQESFDYIRKYMTRIKPKLYEIEKDEAMLKRFALAGLFLTYRAFNSTGDLMSTELTSYDDENIHYKRLKIYKEYFQSEIKNSSQYLKIIDLSGVDFILFLLRIKRVPKFLYDYVIKGSTY